MRAPSPARFSAVLSALLSLLGLLVVVASLYFFHAGVAFLASQEAVAALISVFVGFALLRAGIEMVRLVSRRGSQKIEGERR